MWCESSLFLLCITLIQTVTGSCYYDEENDHSEEEIDSSLTIRTRIVQKEEKHGSKEAWLHGNSTCNLVNDQSQQTVRFDSNKAVSRNHFLVITVATNVTDGFKRFIRSTKVNGLPVQVLGMGQKWEGGDMKYAGGGHKITLLMEALEAHRQKNTIILFTDCYDVIITGSQEDIVQKFEKMNAGIVFGAEANIWPDKTLVDEYPVTESRYKYLNSGGFIGYASDIYDFIKTKEDELENNIDDQLFYTKLFLDFPTREKYRVMLDYKANIFQNLFDALEDIELKFDGDSVILENTKYVTVPSVIHGNGIAKVSLNSLSNYIPHSWTMSEGCISCTEDQITLPENESDYPEVLVGIIISQPTPFLEEFFQRLYKLNYPKGKLHLFIYNSNPYHEAMIDKYLESFGKEYKSIKQIKPSDQIAEAGARTLAIKHCEKKSCSYYLNIDSVAHLDNPNTLKFLIQANRSIIAPLLVRPYKAWSNFWGAIQSDGYYYRSFDYLEIVNYKRLGLWNVPYISSAYLINATLLKSIKPIYDHPNLDPDMSFCLNFREKGVFMYVDNRIEYGHLVDPDGFDTSNTHPEIYELIHNKYDWEQRYLHPNYSENLNPNKTVQQPCPDVYWFPIVTERYCDELIEVMETFGKWSSGSNHDERLDGGYENVPTRDIHMKQVNMEPAWLEFLRSYVLPIQEHVFTGYYQDPLTSIMNFVVRYKPDEQPILRPHHDASTYTINLALNRPNIDYEGGGCKFIRYNCSVIDTKVGWMLMHPGRLTHYHEGLEVKKGTRYIMISFINP